MGGIAVRAEWMEGSNLLTVSGAWLGNSVPGSHFVAPPSVVTMRAIVSGADMDTVTQDFAASANSGQIDAIPVGTNRTVTLQGLDGAGVPIFGGSISGITVTAGEVTPAGTVTLNFLGSLGVLVGPTSGLVLTEAGGSAGFSVVLTGPTSSDVQIPINSSDPGEALLRGGDSPGSFTGAITLTFTSADWFTAQAVEVQGQDDALLDGDVSAVVVTGLVASADAGYAGLNPSDVQVINNDDEVAGDYPIISAIPDKSTPENTTINFILFTADEGVGAAQDPEVLSVTSITSSDQSIVPDGNISVAFTDNGDGGNGEITIAPAAGQRGTATITMTVSDGFFSSEEVFDLTVNPAVDPPLAYNVNASTAQNTPVSLTLAADPVGGDTITSWTIDTPPTNGTLSGTNPNLTYTPDPGFSGRDAFTFYATDSDGEASNLAIVTVIVNGSAIFFVADPTAVTNATGFPGDVSVRNEILGLGFTVTLVDDNDVLNNVFPIGDIDLVDLLIFSSSVGSANIVNSGNIATIRDSTTPILTWERFLYDDFQITSSTNSPGAGIVTGATQIDIVSDLHPLAGGLANGTVTVFSPGEALVWGAVSADGEVVAEIDTLSADGIQPVLFVYEAGDVMEGGLTAPARRVGYFLPDQGNGNLTADALTLLRAAVNAALAR